MAVPSLPPGPSAPSLVQGIGIWSRPLGFSEHCRARYGKRYTTKFPLAPPFVTITDPAEIKQIFSAPPEVLHPGEGARVLEPVVGKNSVILLDEDPHLEQRKLLLPTFHGERMERLSGLMSEVAEREIAAWPLDEEIPLQGRMQSLTLEIILRAVFGLEPGERLESLRSLLSSMLSFGDKPISLFVPEPDSVLYRTLERLPPFTTFLRLQEQIDQRLFELIDERRAQNELGDDVLSMLLEARHDDGSPMSPQELRDELLTLLVAGHETTATSLAWTFERLKGAPRALATLSSEIRAEEGGEAYLTATIQEVLRSRPVLPNVEPRLTMEEIQIGDWTYPAGICLVPNAYLVHHDSEIYENPYSFRPQRFLEQAPGTYTWIPFGGGRRRCIGASFATLEMKVVIAGLLGTRDVEPVAGSYEPARRRNITVSPKYEGRVRLSRSSVNRPQSLARPAGATEPALR